MKKIARCMIALTALACLSAAAEDAHYLEPYIIGSETVYRIDGTDYLTLLPLTYSENSVAAVVKGAKRYRDIASANPGVRFYAYYVTRSRDLDWFDADTDKKSFDYSALYEALTDGSGIRCGRLNIYDFEFYKTTSYKSDFHVNCVGSDYVYDEVYNLISQDFDLGDRVWPFQTLTFNNLTMLGYIARWGADGIENLPFEDAQGSPDLSVISEIPSEMLDEFRAYQYLLPEHHVYVNGREITLGMEAEYAAGEIDPSPLISHQYMYYGGLNGVARFEFGQPDKPNLLMCSDSQGCPSRMVLASHFNTTVYLDDTRWRSEDINALIKKYDIDAVLLIGQNSMFEEYNN